MQNYIIPFEELTKNDTAMVGGKNSSLGEMISHLSGLGIKVPDGFAISVNVYNDFLAFNDLQPKLKKALSQLKRSTLENLAEVGSECRQLIMKGEFPESLKTLIVDYHAELIEKYGTNTTVAVRSSATAEDSPTASFAGQHESYLNVPTGEVLLAVKKCYASLFNDRAIKYRIDNNFDDLQVGQAVGVQVMVRSDKGSAGVAFTIEPETGNQNFIYITGAWGLGESVVQGAVNTDEFYLLKHSISAKRKNSIVYRSLGAKQQMLVYGKGDQKNTVTQITSPTLRDQYVLNDDELNLFGSWCYTIEQHYQLPMDIEWAKDGETGELFIVQARPETIHSKKKGLVIKEYKLKTNETPILRGKSVGYGIVSGKVSIVKSLADSAKVAKGDIIVADITNPDWNALLKRAVCIVTNKGGRTSHASIIARELGIPAVVGTESATEKLTDGQTITVSCAVGDEGLIYTGKLQWKESETPAESIPKTSARPMLILADPQKALLYASYPNEGVGLLRMEFMISNTIQVHPMALVKYHDLPDGPEKKQIDALTRHYPYKKKFFIEKLSESIALVAAAFYPKEVIVRMSDFKTNEYSKLLGGKMFEPAEENPMLGFRGASRYYNERYREGFGLECMAIKKVRDDMGLANVKVMIPFCRTPEEGKKVLEVMKENGLERGKNGLEVYVMAEIPSNILLANEYVKIFDGFSIGSNDLTQLTLGLDRDSSIVSDLFDENNNAIKKQIKYLITTAHENGLKVGLCGQAPSDYPEFCSFLVECGIDSISFNPDALLQGIRNISSAEKTVKQKVYAP